MGKDEDLSLAKRSYRTARAEGNRQEEARWANVVGDILKNRGEYVEALKWLRLDYEVSVKYLPEKQLLPTCQSLGELYLRLNQFKDALIYQKNHLELAKDANDLVEQQRASTQLGRTYHEMLLRSDDDHYSVRNAKKYFRLAMKLAQSLKERPPTNNRCSFVKEYVDAHNNIGMLEKDRDNFEEAERFLTKGLEICDEEEIGENDDSRSRLHHNLGSVYLELRVWDKAMEHIEKDILICKRIGHIQGEAKGYINLGELHYRVQKYEDAIHCYKKALDLAKSMEDEDALVEQIDQNIEIVQSAMKVLDEMKKEEQILKKLTRKMETARGTPSERRCLLQQNAALDRLIEKSSMIFSWLKHREFAKRKKRIVSQLCDKEKLGDSFLVLGESYQKLRNFKKSIKWFQRGLEMYKSIGNLEGQALAKINIGDVLDSDGDWNGALHAFEDGYRLAADAKCPSVQLLALENMHYSNMIRFDNIEEARRLQLEIDKLKQLKDEEFNLPRRRKNQCSETDSDGDDCLSDRRSTEPSSPEINRSTSSSKFLGPSEEMNDDVPLVSLLRSHKHSLRQKTVQVNNCNLSNKENGNSPEQVPKEISAQKKVVGRKRIRLVLSDDESETQDVMNFPRARHHECLDDDIAFLNENRRENNPPGLCRFEDIKTRPSKYATCSCCSPNVEESSSSYQSLKPDAASQNNLRSSYNDLQSDFAISGCKSDVGVSDNAAFRDKVNKINLQNADSTGRCLTFMIDNDPIHVKVDPCFAVGKSSTESLKAELACLYYIRLPMEKRSKGLLPIIQHMKSGERFVDFEAFDTLKEHPERLPIEVSLAWVQKRLIKLYIDCCEELSEPPNLKLLKKLYISEVEDVVSASDCELQDVSITPLLNALCTHNSIAIIDLSHNLLGNGTIEKLQKLFTLGLQYGGLTLDLHCNRFGPTALFQICECPVLFTRLEVLNISGNCLTDTCGSFLSTMLEKCKALFSLNIEHCSITSRTIQKVADSLSPESVLAQLWIGNNNPVSGTSIINLLEKLATLRSFTELSLTNLKLNKAVTNTLCQLLKSSCMSCLMLGSTFIGADGALQLTESLLCGSQEFAKLDFSCCAITSMYIFKLSNNVALVGGIVELNLEGNPLWQEGGSALVSILTNPQCSLKILVLNKCQLGFSETLQVIYALKENGHLEELYLAENFDLEERRKLQRDQRGHSGALHPKFDMSETPKTCELKEFGVEHDVCPVNTSCNQLEVADSEDEAIRLEAAPSKLDDSCTSSCEKHQLSDCQLLEKLSTAISLAKQLQLLDLSSNGFSSQEAETLYSAWSSKSARALPLRHITGDIVHLSTETNRCCRGRPCCRKD